MGNDAFVGHCFNLDAVMACARTATDLLSRVFVGTRHKATHRCWRDLIHTTTVLFVKSLNFYCGRVSLRRTIALVFNVKCDF